MLTLIQGSASWTTLSSWVCNTKDLWVVTYMINQPVNPQLWDNSFYLISLFRMNKYLKGDSKNITCSLLKMAAFIKQHRLEKKIEKYLKLQNSALLPKNFCQQFMRHTRINWLPTKIISYSDNISQHNSINYLLNHSKLLTKTFCWRVNRLRFPKSLF